MIREQSKLEKNLNLSTYNYLNYLMDDKSFASDGILKMIAVYLNKDIVMYNSNFNEDFKKIYRHN